MNQEFNYKIQSNLRKERSKFIDNFFLNKYIKKLQVCMCIFLKIKLNARHNENHLHYMKSRKK